MEPETRPGPGNSQPGTGPTSEGGDAENGGPENGDLSISQEAGEELFSGSAPIEEWKDLQWSLLGFGPEGEEFLSKEGIPEELSSLVEELDSETRRAVKEIDRYASASALAQERAGLMGRADDLRMDLRDMQEQIREMDTAQAGLRSAFQKAYRRPEEALRVWDRLVGETRRFGNSGIEKASQILAASPQRLGRLRGASAFGFSTPARSVSIRSVARAAGLARAYQDAARRATRLGVFGKGQSEGNSMGRGAFKKSLSAEKGTTQYPGLSQKREEIEATRKEAGELAEKVRKLTGGQSLSEQSRAVTERVRSLDPEQRQALRQVILGAGAQPVGEAKAKREAGRSATADRKAVAIGVDNTSALKTPALKRSATARSLGQSQASKKAASKAGAMKGLLKASLRHVAIHVAIRTLDRVEKEARGREMLEI